MFPHPHLRVGSDQTLFLMLLATFATAAIFVLTYAGVLLGRLPGLRLDRSGIALSGSRLDVGNRHANLEFVEHQLD